MRVRRITGLYAHRSLRSLGFRSARSLHSHGSFTHSPTRRNPAGCFIGGLERRIQPERYVQYGLKFL
jgi:hypothetical protein